MSGYFVTGGTMKPGVPSYIERGADAELYDAVLAGEYCFVLTTRQMGKSSLMARTAARLRDQGIACATVDLQGKGDQAPAPAQWYYGVVKQIADGLGIASNWSAWWKQQTMLLPAQLMTDFFADIVLQQISGRVVVFIDEVDWMIRLPFSDEFFAAIRSCFNRRATDRAFERLTFVLLGSAAPAQLIKDATRTPFNVGRGIELTDFTPDEAQPLARQLGTDGARILARVLYWTDGHPYLTQILCSKADAQRSDGTPPETLIDQIVESTLLSTSARQEENNLKFVADRLTQGTGNLRSVLRTYREVLRGKQIADVPASAIHTSLRLSGVVKADASRYLRVRNPVYRRVFDEAWLRRRMPWNVPAIAAALLIVVTGLSTVGYYVGFMKGKASNVVMDEASAAGRTPASFPAANEDYFRHMDGAQPYNSKEIEGRNMWMVWSGGNDRFWNLLARGGRIDLLKTVSSHPSLPYSRDTRFRYLGLINEPCFEKGTGPREDRYGLWLDVRREDCPPDPFENEAKYPGVKIGARGKTVPVGSYYGYATGIVGLRLLPNPEFDDAAQRAWDPDRYYNDPSYYSSPKLIRPYRVGVSCGFCHVGPNPVQPPADPENPKWENLSATVGDQYLWPDRVFAVAGVTNQRDYFYQLLHTWRPGTFDTSYGATDNINNPRAINPLYGLVPRLRLAKRWGKEALSAATNNTKLEEFAKNTSVGGFFEPPNTVWTPRFQADASDSTGLLNALNRFYLSMGVSSEEPLMNFMPLSGSYSITPLDISEREANSIYFQVTEGQTVSIGQFLLRSTTPHRLRDAPGGTRYLIQDKGVLARGAIAFADHCASCHSSKLPPAPPAVMEPGGCAGADYLRCWNDYWAWSQTDAFKHEMRQIVSAPDFLDDNYLSTDLRVPITLMETNACTSLGTNAIAGGIWDRFSSQSYKELPSVGSITVSDPVTGQLRRYAMPGGGRGYTRPPSLISIWASAPFLLNNSLGAFRANPSVDARLLSFESAIRQLLWPATRDKDQALVGPPPGAIDRTTADALVADQVVAGSPIGLIIPRGTPVGLFANLDLLSRDPTTAYQHQSEVQALFRAIADSSRGEDAPRQLDQSLVDAMLKLSKCPDFFVNRGHYFGATLPDQDKRALIEFLKTF